MVKLIKVDQQVLDQQALDQQALDLKVDPWGVLTN